MKRILGALVVGCLVCGCTSDADETDVVWSLTHPDAVTRLSVDPASGDILAVGGLVARLDAAGETRFRIQTNGMWVREAAFAPDDKTVVLGECFGPTVFGGVTVCATTGSAGRGTTVLIELDGAGETQREITFRAGTGSQSYIRAEAVAVAPDGRVHFGGTYNGEAFIGEEVLTTELQAMFYAQLDPEWEPAFAIDFGGDDAGLTDIAVDAATGDVAIVGFHRGSVAIDGVPPGPENGMGASNVVVFRMSAGGDVVWARPGDGSGQTRLAFGDGSVFAFGRSSGAFGGFDGSGISGGPFAFRFDGDGTTQWMWHAHAESEGSKVAIDTAGNVVVLWWERTLAAGQEPIPEECGEDYWGPECSTGGPREYEYRRAVALESPDGSELGRLSLATETDLSGYDRVAAAPDGTIVLGEAVSGVGAFEDGSPPTRLRKIRLTP